MTVSLDLEDVYGIGSSITPEEKGEPSALHNSIFIPPSNSSAFSKKVSWGQDFSPTSQKTHHVAVKNSQDAKPLKGTVEGGIRGSWGGEKDPEITIYISGRYDDEKGNYIEGRAEQDSNGEGSVEVYGGHEDDFDE